MDFRELTQAEQDMVPFKRELVESPRLLVGRADNQFLKLASAYAQNFSHNPIIKLGAIIEKDGTVIGAGANSSRFHVENGCNRQDANGKSLYPSGEGYDCCPGCDPATAHSEALAIKNVYVFGILHALQHIPGVSTTYSELVEQLDQGLMETNLVHDINSIDTFFSGMQELAGRNSLYSSINNINSQLEGSTLFLHGHYWACKDCWNVCGESGINQIVVSEDAFDSLRNR